MVKKQIPRNSLLIIWLQKVVKCSDVFFVLSSIWTQTSHTVLYWNQWPQFCFIILTRKKLSLLFRVCWVNHLQHLLWIRPKLRMWRLMVLYRICFALSAYVLLNQLSQILFFHYYLIKNWGISFDNLLDDFESSNFSFFWYMRFLKLVFMTRCKKTKSVLFVGWIRHLCHLAN